MTTPDYDYHGLIASTWDLWRDDTANWSDRGFYLDVIRRYGQPAIDIGCGTGRLVLDYAEAGIDIDGVDNSPEMLAICRAKAEKLDLSPMLYEQDTSFRHILVDGRKLSGNLQPSWMGTPSASGMAIRRSST